MADDQLLVNVAGVSKSYGKTVVLRDLDFRLGANEIVGIIGPSGSGKSTLLRVLMTLEPIDSGSITIAGTPLWSMDGASSCRAGGKTLRDIRAKVGMVFQHFNLFPHKTALQNITLAPVLRGMTLREAEGKARDLLAMVGLEQKADAFPSELSGGQQQRVAIARSLALEPELLLFDEVTSALDPELVGEVLQVMRGLASKRSTAMIFVTHKMRFARDISDRICFFDGGRVCEEGTPQEIFETPRNARTQAFIESVIHR